MSRCRGLGLRDELIIQSAHGHRAGVAGPRVLGRGDWTAGLYRESARFPSLRPKSVPEERELNERNEQGKGEKSDDRMRDQVEKDQVKNGEGMTKSAIQGSERITAMRTAMMTAPTRMAIMIVRIRNRMGGIGIPLMIRPLCIRTQAAAHFRDAGAEKASASLRRIVLNSKWRCTILGWSA